MGEGFLGAAEDQGMDGGAALRRFGEIRPGSEARNAETYGALRLTLRDGGYDWAFVPVDGQTFRDSGSGHCRD